LALFFPPYFILIFTINFFLSEINHSLSF